MIKFEKTYGGRGVYFPNKFKKDRSGDCVIRSITIATQSNYLKVWNELFDLGKKMGYLPNEEKVYGRYLEEKGFKKMKTLKKYTTNKKYRVKEFPASEDRTYVIHTSGHLTCIKDRVLYDSWNCGPWCAFSYWVK